MRSNLVVVAISQLLLISNTATAQKDSASIPTRESFPARAWIIPVGIAASAALDPEAREWALRTHTHSLDRLAKSVNPLGTARVLVSGIAITCVGALITRDGPLATGTLNTAAAYIASDVVESLLKPVIGRERPNVEGDSHRFHLFSGNGDWHSFPSAHVAHITSIAQAISMQAQSNSLTAACSSLVALMAWDRVYEDQHWMSDVTATIALSSIISSATVRWMESRHSHSP